ncbi:hypothetical protein K437DRAFT_246920 [Tilletiaria anomala UBC 951]|uniref:Lipid droplet-associated hydrolase n=1 Tax=Tilletiaria anomala (strain ATCC 24038 / CBS 436.72 / UBC 951) TaxID=1037660 RepID=A0A066VW49_TILAU|nr:uncharacterized protein K437DRAFT_246920 [Tilletiaria anomala UBC 951]KDN45927.1 hypothetical protein K437DRAFT_246920 [Tilletiaria anomala UBC 951]
MSASAARSALASSGNGVRKALINSLSTPLVTSFAGAQALWWPCASASPSIYILFIPGNPGLCAWYTQYLSCIYNSHALKGKVEILALGHRGHAPLPSGAGNTIFGPNENQANAAARGERTGLADQIRHKVQVVDAIRTILPKRQAAVTQNGTSSLLAQNGKPEGQEPCTKLILLGHSIGCYIAVETLKARPDSIDGVHMLFPAIANVGKTPNAKKLRLLVHPLLPSLMLSLPLLFLSLLPACVVFFLTRIVTRQSHMAARTTADLLLTPGAVLNCIKMAREEFRDVGEIKPDTVKAIQTFTRRSDPGVIRTYWGETDGWAPTWLRDEVSEQLGLQEERLPPTIGKRLSRARSFSVSQAHKVLSSAASSAGSVLTTRSNKTSSDPSIQRQQQAQHLPSASPRKRTRPFHMRTASASRSIDGSIIIQPPANFTDDDETENEALALVLDGDTGGDGGSIMLTKASETGALARGAKDAKGVLTNTICEMGIPHAFCLNHGVEMARITAHWIKSDHL